LNITLKNTPKRFGLVSKALHWVIALLIIGLIALGYYMVGLTYFDRWYNESLSLHKGCGMLALGLAVIDLGWKWYSPSPPFPDSISGPQRSAATAMHRLLLAMMLLIPVTGYAISTSDGKSVSIFGWFDVPALLPENTTVRDWAIEFHYYFAYATAALVVGHAAAALKHHLVDRDDTLARMIWR
jgi:cytochrome b561